MMSFSARIFLGFFLVIGIGAYLSLNTFINELRPGIKQSSEESLIESANLLAELVAPEVKSGLIQQGNFSKVYQRFSQREFNANIWSVEKKRSSQRLYITNKHGIVIYDSSGEALGQDYSQWNDVYLTLRGKYGVRSSDANPNDPASSTMYVAAPIIDNGQIIGVLTLAKPTGAVLPFIQASQQKMRTEGLFLIVISLIMGAIISLWLTRSVRALVTYAEDVKQGTRNPQLPNLGRSELAVLGNAMEQMRIELDGKDYVEKYIHTLTHELKSPIAAIKGAAELLLSPMDEADRQHFINNIQGQSLRLEELVGRLLQLAALENRPSLEAPESVDLISLVENQIEEKAQILKEKSLTMVFEQDDNTALVVPGERFLLAQALDNLINNAIDFSPINGCITLSVTKANQQLHIWVKDQGPGIPDYAKTRIFERFYSLPRPDGKGKSSGLGLSFVAQVAQLHAGQIQIDNQDTGGTVACFSLPY